MPRISSVWTRIAFCVNMAVFTCMCKFPSQCAESRARRRRVCSPPQARASRRLNMPDRPRLNYPLRAVLDGVLEYATTLEVRPASGLARDALRNSGFTEGVGPADDGLLVECSHRCVFRPVRHATNAPRDPLRTVAAGRDGGVV
jgi:hypothetical protein